MHWSSWSELWQTCVQFFKMGGYAPYVWGSYGVTFLLLAGEVLMLMKRRQNLAARENPPEYESDSSPAGASFQELQ